MGSSKRVSRSIRLDRQVVEDAQAYIDQAPEHENLSQFIRYCMKQVLYYQEGFKPPP